MWRDDILPALIDRRINSWASNVNLDQMGFSSHLGYRGYTVSDVGATPGSSISLRFKAARIIAKTKAHSINVANAAHPLFSVSLPIRVLLCLDWFGWEFGGGDFGAGLDGGLGDDAGNARKPCIIQCVSQYKVSPVRYMDRPVINNAGKNSSESCIPTTMATMRDAIPVKTIHRRFIPCLVLGEFKSRLERLIDIISILQSFGMWKMPLRKLGHILS